MLEGLLPWAHDSYLNIPLITPQADLERTQKKPRLMALTMPLLKAGCFDTIRQPHLRQSAVWPGRSHWGPPVERIVTMCIPSGLCKLQPIPINSFPLPLLLPDITKLPPGFLSSLSSAFLALLPPPTLNIHQRENITPRFWLKLLLVICIWLELKKCGCWREGACCNNFTALPLSPRKRAISTSKAFWGDNS